MNMLQFKQNCIYSFVNILNDYSKSYLKEKKCKGFKCVAIYAKKLLYLYNTKKICIIVTYIL